jgi:hypothetical protein
MSSQNSFNKKNNLVTKHSRHGSNLKSSDLAKTLANNTSNPYTNKHKNKSSFVEEEIVIRADGSIEKDTTEIDVGPNG